VRLRNGLLLASLILAGCDRGKAPPRCPGGPLPAIGLGRPVILYPRHRIARTAPDILLAIPGAAAFDLRIEIQGRREVRLRTRRRAIPWPAALPLLRPGDLCVLSVHAATGSGGAVFVVATAPDPMPVDPARWAELGLPAEAWRSGLLAGTEGRALDSWAVAMGLPAAPRWRRIPGTGTIPAPRGPLPRPHAWPSAPSR
jgi:hypothetical protein